MDELMWHVKNIFKYTLCFGLMFGAAILTGVALT